MTPVPPQQSAERQVPEHEVSSAFDAALEQAGSYAALAREVGVSDEYVRQVAIGQRPIRGKLLASLGYETAVVFRFARTTLSEADHG